MPVKRATAIPAAAQTTAHFAIYNEPIPHTSTKPSREEFEKSRLIQRKEGFIRYTADNTDAPLPLQAGTYKHHDINLTRQKDLPWKNATSDVLKADRRQEQIMYTQKIEQKREQNALKEENRWKSMREEDEARIDHVYKLQASGRYRKNQSSMPISPITGQYSASRDGLELLQKDQKVRYQAAVRAYTMDQKGNSDCNPITGQPRQGIPMPIPPPAIS